MKYLFTFFCCIFLLFVTNAQTKERRLALVIGNAKYDNPRLNLPNPLKDAETMIYYLKKCDFEVMPKVENANLEKLIEVINEFNEKMRNYDVGVISFAGHGISINGVNYWIPTDYRISDTLSVATSTAIAEQRSFSLDNLKRNIINGSPNKNFVIFSDACRNNPFRQIYRGNNADVWNFASQYTPTGIITCYSTSQGEMALDNSPFIKAIAKNILTEGLLFEQFWRAVVPDVEKFGGQKPESIGQLSKDFYFVPQKTEIENSQKEEIILTIKGNAPQPIAYAAVSPTVTAKNIPPDKKEVLKEVKVANSKIGKPKIEKPIFEEPKMIYFKRDTFEMGTDDSGKNIFADERPKHKVAFKDFELSTTEVTNKEYCYFLNESVKIAKDSATKWISFKGVNGEEHCRINYDITKKVYTVETGFENHPIIFVSWYGAKAYCKWLKEKFNKNYRLPKEQEWEYAAGNGKQHDLYSWGNQFPKDTLGGNIADITTKSRFKDWKSEDKYNDNYMLTAPIKSFAPNLFKLYDMSDNVSEWCEDWKIPYPKSKDKMSYKNKERAIKGGSWNRKISDNRITFRLQELPNRFSSSVGFRVAIGK